MRTMQHQHTNPVNYLLPALSSSRIPITVKPVLSLKILIRQKVDIFVSVQMGNGLTAMTKLQRSIWPGENQSQNDSRLHL